MKSDRDTTTVWRQCCDVLHTEETVVVIMKPCRNGRSYRIRWGSNSEGCYHRDKAVQETVVQENATWKGWSEGKGMQGQEGG